MIQADRLAGLLCVGKMQRQGCGRRAEQCLRRVQCCQWRVRRTTTKLGRAIEEMQARWGVTHRSHATGCCKMKPRHPALRCCRLSPASQKSARIGLACQRTIVQVPQPRMQNCSGCSTSTKAHSSVLCGQTTHNLMMLRHLDASSVVTTRCGTSTALQPFVWAAGNSNAPRLPRLRGQCG
jgi:hypothetical protein